MILNIKEDIFEINTSESYNRDIYRFNNHIIIPYVNMEIFTCNVLSSIVENGDQLDFSYLIFKDVKEISWKFESDGEAVDNHLIFDHLPDTHYSTDYVEAANILSNHYGYDFEIKYKEQYLYFSDHVHVRNGPLNFWIPVDTPHFKRNMDEKRITLFFDKNSIPGEVLAFMNAKDLSLLETLDLTNSINTNL